MKKSFILLSFANLAAASALADLKPLKDFAPPAIIKPLDKLAFENQFDLTKRDYLDDELLKNGSFSSALFGNSLQNSLLFRHKASRYYTVLNARNTKANRYKTPSDELINFGYKRTSINAIAGFTPNELSDTRFGFVRDELRDDKQPQFAMDAVKTLRNIYLFNQRFGEQDLSNTLNFSLKYITLERHANNYEQRTSPAKMRMQIDRKILKPELSYDFSVNDFHFQLGAVYSNDSHLAKRFMNERLNAYKFADIKQKNYEIYSKNRYFLNEKNSLIFDFSYEQNKAKALKANERFANVAGIPPILPSANDLWRKFYGRTFSEDKLSAFSFRLGYEFKSDEISAMLNYSHLNRFASNNERFASITMPKGAQVGNPFVKPEKHNQINFTMSAKSATSSPFSNHFKINASAQIDFVKDLIIYHKNSIGTLLSKNVDANIIRLNFDANYHFARHFDSSFALNYAYGQNKSDNEPLYQIKPLELLARLSYKNYFKHGSYTLGSAYRYSFKQSRQARLIDKDLGGFGVLDLFANIRLLDSFSISFGLNNALNKTYSEFIAPSHVENFDYLDIPAPARTVYVKFNTTF